MILVPCSNTVTVVTTSLVMGSIVVPVTLPTQLSGAIGASTVAAHSPVITGKLAGATGASSSTAVTVTMVEPEQPDTTSVATTVKSAGVATLAALGSMLEATGLVIPALSSIEFEDVVHA